MNILNEIAEKTTYRIAEAMRQIPLSQLRKQAEQQPVSYDFPMEQKLQENGVHFICEVKKASPSKGVIAASFPYLDIAKEYESAGAAAISVLTEPYYFQGQDQFLREISAHVSIPLLRKDFTVHEYMIYEAKLLGASAILLICSILNPCQLKEYIGIADALGLSAIVETHDADEIQMALNAGARIIGVNNRNLKTFEVDLATSVRLRSLVPSNIIFISESGIHTRDDVEKLEQIHVNAVLIGESFMRAPDKKACLLQLKGESI